MKKLLFTLFAGLCASLPLSAQNAVVLSSPDGNLKLTVRVSAEKVAYQVAYKKNVLVKDALMGFDFDSGPFGANLSMGKVTTGKHVEEYDLVVGKTKHVTSRYNQALIPLTEKAVPQRRIDLVARAFDDGIAFRYEFPEQKNWNGYVMYDEYTQFNLTGNPTSLVLPVPHYTSTHEGLYTKAPYDALPEGRLIDMPSTFHFPGAYLSITEAAVVDYAGMYLCKQQGKLVGKLSPHLGQEKVKVSIDEFPHRTPWRVIMVSDRIGALIESNILSSLCPPCKIEDTSWIKPCRSTFTWWNGNVVPDTTFSPGNNFETNKYYIDFAARNGIDLHSIYGYAETPWYIDDNFNFGWAGPNADVTKPIVCLNMPRIAQYAKSKGVGLHLWVHWRPFYDKLEQACAQYQKWGVKGMMIDFLDRDDQQMIKIQEDILRTAAKYHLFVQFHGSSKPSGLNRTWPNEFTREGTLNYEVYKWDTIINADHDIHMPFSRLLAGVTDYHLGGFRSVTEADRKIQFVNPLVTSTRCHMLAMYMVLESYMTSLCDKPEAYQGQPGFEFLCKVPTSWDETRVPLAEFDQYVTVVRRKGADWWVGSLNNSQERTLTLDLDFLEPGVHYSAELYTDSPQTAADPNKLDKKTVNVKRGDKITLPLAGSGGAVAHIRKL